MLKWLLTAGEFIGNSNEFNQPIQQMIFSIRSHAKLQGFKSKSLKNGFIMLTLLPPNHEQWTDAVVQTHLAHFKNTPIFVSNDFVRGYDRIVNQILSENEKNDEINYKNKPQVLDSESKRETLKNTPTERNSNLKHKDVISVTHTIHTQAAQTNMKTIYMMKLLN